MNKFFRSGMSLILPRLRGNHRLAALYGRSAVQAIFGFGFGVGLGFDFGRIPNL